MLNNHFTIARRNLTRNKVSSFINIGGLAIGMAVAMLIGLWIYDEWSYETYHKNYNEVVQVMQNSQAGDGLVTQSSQPIPLSAELRDKYGRDFKQVAATITLEQPISGNDKAFAKTGCYAEPAFTDIITLNMLKGTATALNSTDKVLLNESTAKAIFGEDDPIDKMVKLNDAYTVQVGGVYKDMPANTRFSEFDFIAPVHLLFTDGSNMDNWYSSSFQIYGLLHPGSNREQISSRIKDIKFEHTKDASKPTLFVFPMQQWYLYDFKNGIVTAGRLQYLWLFGIIGAFVLLLACINFMNLSTARSEKRAKEVGIRKAIGSQRWQLISQFFSESFLVVFAAFILSLLLVRMALPWFNELSGKQLNIVWDNANLWLLSLAFCLFTGLIAGSYPAIYLSSFKPIKVLKGTFRIAQSAALPRKTLVVVQFTVSIALAIGTLMVFRQIEFARTRPIGYSRNNLVRIPYNPFDVQRYQAFRNELLNTSAVAEVAASSSPTTGIWSSANNLDWKGKDPNRQERFGTILIDPSFGQVVQWQVKEGRNFSAQLPSDTGSFIFNEAAIKQMNLQNPLGEIVKWHGKNWKIIGIVKDMVMTSPFDPTSPTVFLMDIRERSFNVINLKLNGGIAASEALGKIEAVYKKYAPATPFTYKFADQEYAAKFAGEERIGKLATVFAILAILISCLGLFGMASFVAEQRTREIGIRKVIGASAFNIWSMLSKEFVTLVAIACFIAIPIAYYALHEWLQHYYYRADLSWWIFATTAVGAMVITLLTISFQSVKAALMNPVKSLRTE